MLNARQYFQIHHLLILIENLSLKHRLSIVTFYLNRHHKICILTRISCRT